jgi:hypothetical protein
MCEIGLPGKPTYEGQSLSPPINKREEEVNMEPLPPPKDKTRDKRDERKECLSPPMDQTKERDNKRKAYLSPSTD